MNLINLLNLAFFAEAATGTKSPTTDEPLSIAISATLGSRSHVKYLFEIIQILINKGHSISYLCSDATKEFSKGYNISQVIVSDFKRDYSQYNLKPFTKKTSSLDPSGSVGKNVLKVYNESFLNYESYYKENKPDLIICDWLSISCIDSAAKFSIPMIIGYQTLSFAENKPYLTIMNDLEPTTIEKYSFLERFIRGIVDPVKYLVHYYYVLNELKRVRNENGVPATPSLIQFKNMGLGIANSYIGFENPRSLPSHLYPIGPILPDNSSSLSSDLQPFFDSHQKILYIAFGSLIKFDNEFFINMLEHIQKLLNDGWIDGIVWGGMTNINLKGFPKFYNVDGVEYSTDSILAGAHHQFKLIKWAPQDAILNHSHTKLFMTHGGLDSIYESALSGTPMMVVPYFGDQPRNAVLIKEHGIGDYIEWPLDGDILINEKLVSLLNPSNIELKTKLRQFQEISKFSSNRKLFAADLIETHANSAKICRISETPNSFEIPCEVKPFLPLDRKISFVKANLIDIYFITILFILITIGLIAMAAIRAVVKLCTCYNKQKKD